MILAAVAIAVTITIFLITRKRKTLDVEFIDDVRILSERASDMRDDIVVTVGKLQLKDPRILTVRYRNTGNQEIVADDFLGGGITTTDKSGPVITSQLVAVSDEAIHSVESGLAPHKSYYVDCLNPGDYLQVQYILDMAGADDKPFAPVCRVKGATRPPKYTSAGPAVAIP